MPAQDVGVDLLSFTMLGTSEKCRLRLDNYQRAYVWNEAKITQLLDDFAEFIKRKSHLSQYYLGTLLLHQKDDEHVFYVIDGQQRLTSLAILYWYLHQTPVGFIDFEFRSTLSLVHVQNAKNTIHAWFEQKTQMKEAFHALFNHLYFTKITVKNEDLAFTFFDTQNNRGVPLSSTDLLKAYHLRAIKSEDAGHVEALQSLCAQKWENIQQGGERAAQNSSHDFAPDLFETYLWCGRNWRGSDVQELTNRDEILNHFGQKTKDSATDKMPLYPAYGNLLGFELELTGNDEYRIFQSPLHMGYKAANLPFALRQPISRGVGFFLYAQKYAALLNLITTAKSSDSELCAVQDFYNQVVSTLSIYLQNLFRLALLVYLDRLGSHGLFRFALYLEHSLGILRLEKDYIRRETPLKFLRETKRNLLDVIAHAYEGEEAIEFLKQNNDNSIYAKENGWANKNNDSDYTVQGRYVKAVVKYYGLRNLAAKSTKLIDEKVDAVLGLTPCNSDEKAKVEAHE